MLLQINLQLLVTKYYKPNNVGYLKAVQEFESMFCKVK